MRLILLATLCLPGSAMAGELPADQLVRTMMQHERAPITTELFLGNPLSLGSVWIDTGASPLAQAADALGVTVIDEGKGNFAWACAVADGEAFWLISDATDFEGEPLITAVIRTAPPVDEPHCAAANLEVDLKFPGLGATLAEIEAEMGSTEELGGEIVGYRTQNTLGDDGGSWIVIDTLSYHLTDGVADAVGFDTVIVR